MSEISPLICAVGASPMPKKLYAVGAEFANPKELYAAAEKVRDKGYKWWDCYTPYYIHGLDQAMGLKKSLVGLFTFTGTFGVFFLLYLLFIRFLPMIAIAEIRAVLPEANPHDPPAVIKNGTEPGSHHV